jgi:signal transduction histidine kinase
LQQERRALERRAAEAEALAHMGTLAAGLAHEIRNPLNAALLQLHLLGRGVARLDEAAREGLERRVTIVEGELKRLERLLSDFLELARPRPMAREPIDVGALVEEVLAFQEPAAQAQGVALHRRVSSEVYALGDRERMKQVLHNLVANALEATPAGGVTVSCARVEGTRVAVRVSDTGRGIPRATLAQIFEPFFTTKEAGTGLGLSIVRQIVQRLDGDVTVQSVEGAGTEVTVLIPASATPPAK